MLIDFNKESLKEVGLEMSRSKACFSTDAGSKAINAEGEILRWL